VTDETRDRGLEVRRSVLGDAHVDKALNSASTFDRDFQEYITRNAWGAVWGRPGLDARTRSLLTLVLLAALGHWEEFAMHVRATRNTDTSADEVREALFHVAVYAGVPAANRAFAIARDHYSDLDEGPG